MLRGFLRVLCELCVQTSYFFTGSSGGPSSDRRPKAFSACSASSAFKRRVFHDLCATLAGLRLQRDEGFGVSTITLSSRQLSSSARYTVRSSGHATACTQSTVPGTRPILPNDPRTLPFRSIL